MGILSPGFTVPVTYLGLKGLRIESTGSFSSSAGLEDRRRRPPKGGARCQGRPRALPHRHVLLDQAPLGWH